MRKFSVMPLAAAAGILVLAGCGGSTSPSSAASTPPSASPSATGTSASGNVAACHKVDTALAQLTSLVALKHPTAAVLETRFKPAAAELQAASSEATSELKVSIDQFDRQLSADATGLRSGKIHLSSLSRLEAGLATSVRAIEARCEGIIGKP